MEETKDRKFHALALPALLYALLTTFFLYHNFSGITLPLYVVMLTAFLKVTAKRLGREVPKSLYLYSAGMLFLSIGIVRTANEELIFWGQVMIFVLTAASLLHLFCQDRSWPFGKYVGAFLQLCFGTILSVGDLFADLFAVIRSSKDARTRNVLYLIIGVAILIPVGGVIISLLISADAVFGSMVRNLLRSIFLSDNVIRIPCFFLGAFWCGYCGIRCADKGEIRENVTDRRHLPSMIAGTVLLPLTLLYLFFSGIQIFSLFLGQMQLPQGYTYAEYAREGFFELMWVCLINVLLVVIVQSLFRPHPVIKVLLLVISLCTYVMLSSAALRIGLYISVYHLTMLRLLVIWDLVMIAVGLLFVTITVFRETFPLAYCALALLTVGMIVWIWIRPDAVIARYNLAHIDGNTDYTYLSSLSADAAGAICGQEGSWVDSYITYISYDCEDRNLLQYNFSRAAAVSLFGDEMAEARKEISFYLCNKSGMTVTGMEYEVRSGEDTLISGGISNADGSPIEYSGDGIVCTDPFLTLTRQDLRACLGDDASAEAGDAVDLTVFCTFEGEDCAWTCQTDCGMLKPGDSVVLDLEWNETDQTFEITAVNQMQ